MIILKINMRTLLNFFKNHTEKRMFKQQMKKVSFALLRINYLPNFLEYYHNKQIKSKKNSGYYYWNKYQV